MHLQQFFIFPTVKNGSVYRIDFSYSSPQKLFFNTFSIYVIKSQDITEKNFSIMYAGIQVRLYFLSLYNGGIDAQNTHFQSNKSQNELHFLKYSSIFSFWAKIKRPSVLQPTVKQVYGTEKFIFSIRNDIIILFAL